MKSSRLVLVILALLALTLAACGDVDTDPSAAAKGTDDFSATVAAAQGQTVRWWLYGGDAKVNAYVDDVVTPAAAKLGVKLERVPVTDTADAVQRVVSERRAGKRSGGAVDLIWINGENFASGKKAGLWLESWARALPNAKRYLDPDDTSLTQDFQVPVDGQESPWQRAAFVFAHDTARTPQAPSDLDALLAYAKANPGRVTYPAPPDFTGSAFVRQVVAEKGLDGAMEYLREIAPHLYREGRTYPKSEAELTKLFGDGKLDLAMSYDSSFVNSAVAKGQMAKTTRPFVLGDGALQNTSYVTIPANAANAEGAQVIADLLLRPDLQARKADPASLGNPSVLDMARLGSRREVFAAVADSPYLLVDFGKPIPEVAADRVAPIEDRWRRDVLQAGGT